MSRSWYADTTRRAPLSAAECEQQQTDCLTQATDLCQMADELVTEAHLLHDSSPRRRALLGFAACMRKGAGHFTDAGEQYGEWARSLRSEVGA